jgi:hypothetical protein
MMSMSSTKELEATGPPMAEISTGSTRATAVWLLQIVFPTIGLAYVLTWLIDPYPFGRLGWLILITCVLWYGGCFAGLAFPIGHRWIAGHSRCLVVSYLVLTSGLVGAELVCRSIPDLPYDPRLPHITKWSARLGWSFTPGAGDISEHGWRLPAYPFEKEAGHFRIVCLGDSTTYGNGCTWKKSWPHQLEELLRQDVEWTSKYGITEVLNLGCLMYGPDQSFLALKDSGLKYRPDIVIYHLSTEAFADVAFDYNWRTTGYKPLYKPSFILKEGRPVPGREYIPMPTDAAGNVVTSTGQILPGLQLHLFSFLRGQRQHSWLGGSPPSKTFEPTKAHWPVHDSFKAEYATARPLVWALIKEMSSISSDAGAAFLVTLSPHSMNSAEDRLPWRTGSFLKESEDDARSAALRFLNCVPDHFAEGGNERFLRGNERGYLNADGNALIARQTMRWLKDQQ